MAFYLFVFDIIQSPHEKIKTVQANIGGVYMSKKKNQNKKPGQSEAEKKLGYGDKKLEGPNRPAD